MSKSVAEILNQAADLLEKPGAWIQGASARTAPDGRRIPPADDRATCWCVLGALCRVTTDYEEQDRATRTLKRFIGEGIDDWNDRPRRTQEQVVAKLREVAALLPSPPSQES